MQHRHGGLDEIAFFPAGWSEEMVKERLARWEKGGWRAAGIAVGKNLDAGTLITSVVYKTRQVVEGVLRGRLTVT